MVCAHILQRGMMKSILFAATEHGSFKVIYPVLKACLKRYRVGYVGLRPLFEKGVISADKVSILPGIDDTKLGKFDIFVTGSSASSGDIESRLWIYASGNRKKSICILDQHKELRERFLKRGKAGLPDIICVAGSDARDALLRLGVEKKRVIIVGSPYLEDVKRYITTDSERKMLKDKICPGSCRVITFCTEYIARSNKKAKYGFDEHSTLEDIIGALEGCEKDKYVIYIRLHPNDSKSVYERYIRRRYKNIKFRIMGMDKGYQMLQISDLVIGMSSIILVEAHLLGLSVLSYQPSRPKGRVFIYNDVIRRNLVCDKRDLPKAISSRLSGRNRVSEHMAGTGTRSSMENILDAIDGR